MESEGLFLVELSWLVANLSMKNSLVGVIGFLLVVLILEFKPSIVYGLAVISCGFCSESPGLESSVMVVAVNGFSSLDLDSLSVLLRGLSSPSSTSERSLWVFGSMPLCLSFFLMHEFHRFFISLSVLPGNCAAI